MAEREALTAAYVRSILDYNHETGVFTWRARERCSFQRDLSYHQWISCFSGKEAGCIHKKGYVHIVIRNKQYKAHRLAWLYVTGEWPKDQIDHRDGDRSNNRWRNLRESSNAENLQNLSKFTSNSGRLLGVSKFSASKHKPWKAQIRVNGDLHYLGIYATQELAHEAYARAKNSLHKFQPYPRD